MWLKRLLRYINTVVYLQLQGVLMSIGKVIDQLKSVGDRPW